MEQEKRASSADSVSCLISGASTPSLELILDK